MVSRIAAFVIWAAVAGSAVYWALRLWAQPLAAPAHAERVSMAGGFNGELSRVLGSDAAPVSRPTAAPVQTDARYRLIGVVAPRVPGAGQGVALIATDGKPPKAYRVGTVVEGELVLQAVHSRGASLGPRGQTAMVDLQLPALPPPSGGALPRPAGPVSLPPLQPLQPRPPQSMAPPVPGPPSDDDEPEPLPDPAAEPMQRPPTVPVQRLPTVPTRPPT